MATTHKRPWLISSAILVASLILLFEGFSYVYVKYNPVHFITPPRDFVDKVDSDWLTRFYRTTYDRNLGWQPKPNFKKRNKNSAGKENQWSTDKYGGRRNPDYQASLSPYIATFGNSWTFGSEVNDDETWQYYLSKILGRNVANYGVGGYGTDQAYLRFREKLDEGLSPSFSILGIYSENFKRVLNRFRPYYYPGTRVKLGFKPRAYLDQSGRLAFLAQELDTPVYDRQTLTDLAEASRVNDFWASYRPWSEFPFSLNLMRSAKLGLCKKYPFIPTCDSSKEPSWDSPEVKSIMMALVIEFVRTSRKKNIQPIILFISPGKHSNYSSFVEELRKYYRDGDVTIIDVTEAEREQSKFRNEPPDNHASPYGNEIIAKHIARYFSTAPTK